MTIQFQRMNPDYIRQNHPRYYREDITCFLILKDSPLEGPVDVGLYGLINRGIDPLTQTRQAEAFLTIFPAFRYQVLGKGFFLGLFDHAFKSGFDKVYTWTRLTSWQKLLDRFEPLGIHRLQTPPSWSLDSSDCNPTKVWFSKDNKRQSKKEED